MALAWLDSQDFERGRKRLLGEADQILDSVEELRLADRRAVPPELAQAIETLQQRLGRRGTSPTTLGAAHRLVLALEGRLMGANPRVPKARAHADRPAGQPVVKVIPGGLTWKLLALPALAAGTADDEWWELVDATVDRACERWLYAHEQLLRAARDPRDRRRRRQYRAALERARTAWANYWMLSCEAEELHRRVAKRPARS
jgi:hypothetical protein